MDKKEKQLETFLDEVFPQIKGRFNIIALKKNGALVRMGVRACDLRPGGTVSGPSMFSLADISFYVAALAATNRETLAVTTNCSINFLRKPDPTVLFGKARILKIGRKLIVGDVEILDEHRKLVLAHASMTYSRPPK